MKTFRGIFMPALAILAIFFMSGLLAPAVSAAAKVNINTANATELDAIPEVGPSTAAKIIAYREASGPFSVIEDIMKVSGIKEATFAKMKDYITVGDAAESVADTAGTVAEETDAVVDNTADSDTASVSTSEADAHYEQEDISDYTEPDSGLKVSAGRDRLAFVGSPISFEAKYKTGNAVKNQNLYFSWSFGDGSSSRDADVVHIYKYPGEYNVVLNASMSGENSVSRTAIKVLAPDLAMSVLSDGAVKVANQAKSEINLYGWKLVSGDIAYAFPLDTIISAGKSVILAPEYLKISTVGAVISLVDASSKTVTQTGSVGLSMSMTDFEKLVSVVTANTVVQTEKPIRQPTTLAVAPNLVLGTSTSSSGNEEYWSDHYDKVTQDILGTSSASTDEAGMSESDQAGSAGESRGFWSKLFHPVRTIQEAFYQ